ncbi:hypothetical protein CIK05_01290 [Bdellovibrio sp. qaytius]|nr:hypothetical protein CIK05_01290 [Bdellovibrio sp. qaytius]
MNNWIKQSITGLVLTASTVASAIETQNMKQQPIPNSDQVIDAMDFAGGSKMKDRMIQTQQDDKILVVRILLDA